MREIATSAWLCLVDILAPSACIISPGGCKLIASLARYRTLNCKPLILKCSLICAPRRPAGPETGHVGQPFHLWGPRATPRRPCHRALLPRVFSQKPIEKLAHRGLVPVPRPQLQPHDAALLVQQIAAGKHL